MASGGEEVADYHKFPEKASIPCIYISIYISVAKPYGRFGQKFESLQAGQERTGQGKTGQGRGTDQKRAEQK